MSFSPDPLSANWSYDSAIDLFSLNSMVPETFPLDIPSDMLWDPKELPADFFAAPSDIKGFTVSNHSGEDSLSDESDDQAYSPTNIISTPPTAPLDPLSPIDFPSPQQPPVQLKRKQSTPSPTTTKSPRYSSSPELHPQEPSSRKIPRSLSDDSARGRNAAKRAAHNIIEKRYRTNMNAKFVALEKAMTMSVKNGKPSSASSPSSSGKSSASLKKSEILTNAIAYMQELQETNERLRKEIAVLSQGVRRPYC